MKGLVLAGALASVLTFGPTPAVSAYTVSNQSCPGAVQVPRANGYGSYMMVDFPRRYVWRSACSNAAQIIKVTYRLWALNLQTGWFKLTELTRTGQAPVGSQGVWIDNFVTGVLYKYVSADVNVEWRTSSGQFLGSSYLNYNSAGDYSCIAGPCGIFANEPTMGAGLALGY